MMQTQSAVLTAGIRPTVRECPERGLETDHAVERGWYACAACCVGADGEGDEFSCHADYRAGRAAAGHVLWVVHAARHPVGRACAGKARGKLVEIGFADENATSVKDPLDNWCSRRRSVCIAWAG